MGRHPVAPRGAHPAHEALDGDWTVERVSGLLPPMLGISKSIRGGRGETRIAGLVRLPFTVAPAPGGGARIAYRAPLAMIVDEVTPDGQGGWSGISRVAGVGIGAFRMRRA
jgi:hypothetical protein